MSFAGTFTADESGEGDGEEDAEENGIDVEVRCPIAQVGSERVINE